MKHLPSFENFINEATANSGQKEAIMNKFAAEIEKAQTDKHDIASALEEVMDKYKEKYPQFTKDFDEKFAWMDKDARLALNDLDIDDEEDEEEFQEGKKEPEWIDTSGEMFDKAWEICKAHGLTKKTPMSKQQIKRSRPGYVSFWLADLQDQNLLTPEEKKILGLK